MRQLRAFSRLIMDCRSSAYPLAVGQIRLLLGQTWAMNPIMGTRLLATCQLLLGSLAPVACAEQVRGRQTGDAGGTGANETSGFDSLDPSDGSTSRNEAGHETTAEHETLGTTIATDPSDSTSRGDSSSGTADTFFPGDGSSTGATTGTGETGGCVGNMEVAFSYIWIANSPEGTVSKVDTKTAVEHGRYLVSETPSGNASMGPSRTSVNLEGDVAVLDRDGGLAKFYARESDCQNTNGTPGIQTATGSGYLAWGEEECRAWRIALPKNPDPDESRGPRAVAWTASERIADCSFSPAKVWVAFPHEDASGKAVVYLIDGEVGTILNQGEIADCDCPEYGPYGGAVDGDNNFWFFDRDGTQRLYKVDYPASIGDPLAITPITKVNDNDYGITVDSAGRVWLAGESNMLSYYQPDMNMWVDLEPELDAYFMGLNDAWVSDENILRGLMQDGDGMLWIATITEFPGDAANPGLLRVDTTVDPMEFTFFGTATFPELAHSAGISIDVDGYVWLVDTGYVAGTMRFGEQAFKIDPVDQSYTIVDGLVLPYTYSDMTGYGLVSVIPR